MNRRRHVYRNLKTLGEAKEIFFSRFKDLLMKPESVPARQALGRFLAAPVKAVRSVPAYHSAAMDGVAVRASTTYQALPESPILLQAGAEAIQVNTGAPLPDGADAVVMIENVESSGDVFEIREAAYPWQNVRKAGEDIVKGEILLPAHHQIRPIDQGVLLAAGVLSVQVFMRPRALILPTGNEIVRPEEAADPLEPGAILEVNGQVLASMIAECGAEADLRQAIPDDPGRIREAVTSGVEAGNDVILIIAGSSAGSEDYTPSLLAEMGELLVHGVTVMPGKPTLLAAVKDRPVVGVPGYPVSAVIAFREFVRPLLYRMQGVLQPEPGQVEAFVGRKLPSKPGLEEHVRVILGNVGERVVAIPLAAGAGVMTSLVRADGILRIPSEVSGYSEGEKVRVELLTPAHSLGGRLLAVGSHDLTIDLLASMIREESEGQIMISSSNVGSLGGLLAINKGIAHFAGAHLLDTETGDYNRSYVRRYLPGKEVALLTLVHRWQGLMLCKGNPKGIQGIPDLMRSDLSIINRQAGSGTRILLDYELHKAGIDPGRITGYRNEEYTHMSVAMAVASGRADAGLGILAAARALDLDFVPVTRERYDLVLPAGLLEDSRVRLLLEIIRSSRFKDQVLSMGGYEVEETGRIAMV
jgi:molybdenum cofactor synthesis domain-containing protein